MTTSVTVKATCGDENEVVISLEGKHTGITTVLQNGEEYTVYVHDDIRVSVFEQKKENDDAEG